MAEAKFSSFSEELRTELEALESILVGPGEFSFKELQSDGDYCCIVHIKPVDVSVQLDLALPVAYPLVKKSIHVQVTPSSHSYPQLNELQEILQHSADELTQGEPVIYQLVTLAKDWLENKTFGEHNKDAEDEEISKVPGKAKKMQPPTKASGCEGKKKSKRKDDLGPPKKPRMKTAAEVISRIQWDKQVRQEDFIIGYLDRFVGIIEKPFAAFSWEDLATVDDHVTLAIPQHRIQYFKYKDEVVWNKAERLDNVFGSTGSGKTILETVDAFTKENVSMEEKETSDLGEDKEEVGTGATDDAAGGGAVGGASAGGAAAGGAAVGGAAVGGAAAGGAAVGGAAVGGAAVGGAAAGGAAAGGAAAGGAAAGGAAAGGADQISPVPAPSNSSERSARSPNHFFAIRITDRLIQRCIQRIQNAVCYEEPKLKAARTKLPTIHITLCTLRLDTEDEKERAINTFKSLHGAIRTLLAPSTTLEFRGLGHFRNSVLFAKPEKLPAIEELSTLLQDNLANAGLKMLGNREVFQPHLTVMKTTYTKRRRGPSIQPELYEQFLVCYIGTQAVSEISLCSMVDPRQEDGFYSCLATLNIES